MDSAYYCQDGNKGQPLVGPPLPPQQSHQEEEHRSQIVSGVCVRNGSQPFLQLSESHSRQCGSRINQVSKDSVGYRPPLPQVEGPPTPACLPSSFCVSSYSYGGGDHRGFLERGLFSRWWPEPSFAIQRATVSLTTLKRHTFGRFVLGVLILGALFLGMRLILSMAPTPQNISARLARMEAGGDICNKDYNSNTVKLAHEASAFSLLPGGWPQSKFEASDVVAFNQTLYFVCDSSFSLMTTDFALTPLSPQNRLIGPSEEPKVHHKESDWEALWVDDESGIFYVLREAVTHKAGKPGAETAPESEMIAIPGESGSSAAGKAGGSKPFHAHIQLLQLTEGKYKTIEDCRTEFSFSNGNKGFEGLLGFRDANGEIYLAGLCEGNYCDGGARGKKSGNGRMVLMKKDSKKSKCYWKTVKVLELPTEINFQDYSAVTNRGNVIAIASQADSRLWVGRLNLEAVPLAATAPSPTLQLSDPEKLEVLSDGKILHFPRDNNCNVVYCNIEGIAFINDRMIAAVSDKTKNRQHHRCVQKDQSIHVFSLPASVCLEYMPEADSQELSCLDTALLGPVS